MGELQTAIHSRSQTRFKSEMTVSYHEFLASSLLRSVLVFNIKALEIPGQRIFNVSSIGRPASIS